MPKRIHRSYLNLVFYITNFCETQLKTVDLLLIISTEGRNLSRVELDRKDISVRSRWHVSAMRRYKKPESGSLIVLRLDCSLAPLLSHRSRAQRTMKAFRSAA